MRLLGLDVETTGLEWEKERVLEIGISLHEAGDPIYLHQNTWTLYDPEISSRLPLSPEIKALTGLRDEAIREFGVHPATVYRELDHYCAERRVEFIVAHNGTHFDRPFIIHELDKLGVEATCFRSLPWLDTRRDLPYKKGEEPKSRTLEHLLMKKRFIPAISHRALADAAHTMWLLSHYNLEEVLEYWKIPWVVLSVGVSFHDKDLAKAQGYQWQEVNYKIYPKQWVKLVKETEVESERKKFPAHEIRIIG